MSVSLLFLIDVNVCYLFGFDSFLNVLPTFKSRHNLRMFTCDSQLNLSFFNLTPQSFSFSSRGNAQLLLLRNLLLFPFSLFFLNSLDFSYGFMSSGHRFGTSWMVWYQLIGAICNLTIIILIFLVSQGIRIWIWWVELASGHNTPRLTSTEFTFALNRTLRDNCAFLNHGELFQWVIIEVVIMDHLLWCPI